MQAVILAAGKGERMMPLTQDIPKPLLKINGKPMIQYVIELLVAHGVTEIGINLFYLGDKIKAYLGDGSNFGVKIIYIEESSLTGTAGGMKSVVRALKPSEPFFVISSDMMINFDLSDIYKFHLSRGGIATLCCYFRPRDQLKKSGVILFDQQTQQIQAFKERPQTEEEIISQWVNSSVYLFDPKIIESVPDEVDGSLVVDLPKHVFPNILASNEKMYAYPIDQNKYYQLGIDTPDRIERAENDILSQKFIPVAK